MAVSGNPHTTNYVYNYFGPGSLLVHAGMLILLTRNIFFVTRSVVLSQRNNNLYYKCMVLQYKTIFFSRPT